MAFTFVGGNVASGLNSASITLDLTALTGGSNSSPSAGDIVLCYTMGVNTINSAPVISSSGWNNLGTQYANGSSWDTNTSLDYKVMGATPDTSVVKATGTGGQGCAMAVQVWRNEDTNTPIDVTTTFVTGTGTAVPNPPSITPLTTGAMVIAFGGADGTVTSPVAPTGYSNLVASTSSVGSVHGNSVIASKAWSGSGAEDPGTFGGFPTTSTLSWAAATVALRPITTLIINESVPDVAVAAVNEGITAMWVLPSDVKSGVTYGPNGNDFTGTLPSGGSGMPRSRITNA